ncbi:MAG TPA: hypothetical protein VFJ95_03655 [Gammaproteobacteria bacterium]|nr:hypothetical protein [Gammaproteobacteria bacterium]
MLSKSRAAVALVTLAAAAVAAWTATSYRDDIRRARESVAAGSTVADTPCGPMEYAVTGSGSPVLSIHGAGGGFDQGLVLAASSRSTAIG